MKKGIILIVVILAIGIIFLFQTQNNNLITSFAAKTDSIDINIDLFPLSREIKQGEDVRVSARIDTHQDEMVDVTISYTITNDRGIVVFQKTKTLAVERTAKVTDNLMIHRTLDPGPYLVDIEAGYNGKTKSERETFQVVAEPVEITFGDKEATLLLFVLIILIIFLIMLWIQNRRVSKILKAHEKCDIEHVMK